MQILEKLQSIKLPLDSHRCCQILTTQKSLNVVLQALFFAMPISIIQRPIRKLNLEGKVQLLLGVANGGDALRAGDFFSFFFFRFSF
jgi:hypothetical protein